MMKSCLWGGAVVLFLVLSPGCKKGEGGTCYKWSDCNEGLACIGADGALSRCEKCDASDGCKIDGKCAVKNGQCVAADDGQCQQSQGCKQSGACSAKNGACVAAKDDDCKLSEGCKSAGLCVAKDMACTKPD